MQYAYEYYDTYKTAPALHALKWYCENSAADAEVKSQWAWFLYNLPLTDGQFIFDRVNKFVTESVFLLAMLEAQRVFQRDPDKLDSLPEIFRAAEKKLALKNDNHGILLSHLDAQGLHDTLFAEPLRNTIPAMWPSLNAFSGGFGRGELFTFAGPPNGGKSWCLSAAAASGLKAGGWVTVISGEMSDKITAIRILSLLLGKSEAQLRQDPIHAADMLRQYREAGGGLCIYQLHGATIQDVHSLLLHDAARFGRYPDMVVLDYADLFIGNMFDDGSFAVRHQIAQTYRQFRDLSVQYKFAGVTASQLNRESENKRTGIGGLAECYEKAAISDVIWMLLQTEEMRKLGEMLLYNAKDRNKPRGKEFSLRIDWGKGRAEDLGHVSDLDMNELLDTLGGLDNDSGFAEFGGGDPFGPAPVPV